MICPQCQAQNVPDARFCIRCGTALAPSTSPGFPTDATTPPMPPGVLVPSAPSMPLAGASPLTQPAYTMPPAYTTPGPYSMPLGSSPPQPSSPNVTYAYPNPQVAQPQAPSPAAHIGYGLTQQRPAVRGFIIATIGNAVAVVAFFIMHYIELPLVGGYSGSQLAGIISSAYSIASTTCTYAQQLGNTQCSVPPIDPAIVLWLEVILAAVAALDAGMQWVRISQSGTPGVGRPAVAVLIASGLSLLLIIGVMLLLQGSTNMLLSQNNVGASVNVFQYLGAGYWIMVLGTVAGIGGAIMQLSASY